MQQYSAKDFGRTKQSPELVVPERLLHSQVEASGIDTPFSGERRHPVFVVDLPSRTLSVTVGHLAQGERTRKHRHTYETILYILEGSGTTTIEDKVVEWTAGDAVYVPVWAWHFHENRGTGLCRYLACENAPMLQNLGAAVREEQ